LGSFTHWIMAALISLGFPTLARWSRPLPFVFFAAITVVQFFVVLLVYPETKGVSLEKIQQELSGREQPVTSAHC
jgi:membrane protein implicated in regulation of membrane protease activity